MARWLRKWCWSCAAVTWGFYLIGTAAYAEGGGSCWRRLEDSRRRRSACWDARGLRAVDRAARRRGQAGGKEHGRLHAALREEIARDHDEGRDFGTVRQGRDRYRAQVRQDRQMVTAVPASRFHGRATWPFSVTLPPVVTVMSRLSIRVDVVLRADTSAIRKTRVADEHGDHAETLDRRLDPRNIAEDVSRSDANKVADRIARNTGLPSINAHARGVALILFDCAVNQGVTRAVTIPAGIAWRRARRHVRIGVRGIPLRNPADLIREIAARAGPDHMKLDSLDSTFGLGWARRLFDVYDHARR